MEIITTPAEMRNWSLIQKKEGKTIGFVPTMGALHEGHLSLMRASVAENDVTVVSIFVNPTQFAPNEDYESYPRSFEKDRKMCFSVGVDVIYNPTAEMMYPNDFSTYVVVENVSEGLCGKSRPHFFRGVATVVTKLFNAVLPDRAYFGQKDAQQCAVIKRMVRDLDMGIEIVEMPIVREEDGLAMSSRNQYLTPTQRKQALCISRGLFKVNDMIKQGERSIDKIKDVLSSEMSELDIDYIEIVNGDTMEPLNELSGNVLIAVAVWVGRARLIDNIKVQI
ncbi:MAG TPA: pantoate--beta-alanine ligase [Candidatus Hydrogenedens sp.]|nr:pantoate--beta-alanine ligase [Candidatus Hydrogenedens sp.]HOL21042.1 pantoate--beta-alanine ligase [Candidatus Hydrogenedens sp.]HPP59133.1 pantoate--beta-alanine ligase [Candidatus Hydrogenedens sp.]